MESVSSDGPGESTVGYPVDSRSECNAGAAAFVRAAAESRGHEFRVALLGLGPVSYFNFDPSFLGFCILDYGGFWPVNQILIDGKKKKKNEHWTSSKTICSILIS